MASPRDSGERSEARRSRSHRGGEAQLLRALRAGDREAANTLIEKSYEQTYAALFRLVGGNGDLASELTQETYRKAWSALGGFDGRSQFATWLYRIAYNTFLNHVRRPAPVGSLEGQPEPVDRATAVEDALMSREAANQLRRAVLALPEELRYVVTGRYWGELPVREMARQLGLTSAAVRKRLRRAYLILELAVGEEVG